MIGRDTMAAQDHKKDDAFAHGGNLAEIRERHALDGRPLLDFSANINPLGMPDSVRNAILANISSLLHYPDTECRQLRRKLAERLQVAPQNVIVGNGSTELMFLVARALLRGTASIVDPTFTEYRHAVEHMRGRCISHVATESNGFALAGDLVFRAARSGQVVFVCNPNNPTGGVMAGAEIMSVISRCPETIFVVDEAFCDFLPGESDVSVVSLAAQRTNLVVLRSLTKFFGIPGLRLGYLVAHETNVTAMLKLKEPWTVNSLAEAAGCAALDDVEFCRRTRQCVAAWKNNLAGDLGTIKGIHVFPSAVNFMLLKIVKDRVLVPGLQEKLLAEGILIRNCSNFPGLDARYFRVAVRTPEENARLVEGLREALGGIG